MRKTNAEWDFMGRTFLAWSLAEMAQTDPAFRPRALDVIDRILDETLQLEREGGTSFFLMDYARQGQFRDQPPRSLFLDGEIALTMGLRRMVEEHETYRPLLAERVRIMEERMRRGPVLAAESYPDECWTFCNAAALAAIKIADRLDATDHSALFKEWVAGARKKLVDPRTGMLISSFHWDGQAKDGPEGSSIWFVAHCLRLVDREFAQDQYWRAKRELARSALGFGWAREWPASWVGTPDVDSGPIVPLLEASAGSSGLALLAAKSFGDNRLYRELTTSLNLAGFPVREGGGVRYAASNQLGDAVILYSSVVGPLWDRVAAR
jgi:hypothetical protein